MQIGIAAVAAALIYGVFVLFIPIFLLGIYHRVGVLIEVQRNASQQLARLIALQAGPTAPPPAPTTAATSGSGMRAVAAPSFRTL